MLTSIKNCKSHIKIIYKFTLMFCVNLIYAHNISGIVRASDTKLPLKDVGVYNAETGIYAYTNASGYFELNDVSENNTIYFYQLGYGNYKHIIKATDLDKSIAITMQVATAALDQVLVVSQLRTLSAIVNVDVKTSPVKSAQEILRKVPGLIIGQHAGGGKAEQIFLRGFDIDHGTDIAIDVDGMPVNMVSHAHGQGYADMHFVIPETIKKLDFGKGSYYADKGNFNTAGYVSVKTKEAITDNVITVEAGQFNTIRALSMIKLFNTENTSAYLANEINLTDGVFESPQNFNRFNILGRFNYNNYEDEALNIGLSHFQSKWNASGQIPQRAIYQGLIGRFGAIDDTEGGTTSRTNLWLNHKKHIDKHSNISTAAYVSFYDFELFSNFTFFLENPINGDQIRQFENRKLLGGQSVYERYFHTNHQDQHIKLQAGIGFRYDDVNAVQLSQTRNRRELLNRLAFGDTDEVNGFSFVSAIYKHGNWTVNPGLRLDYFTFDYTDFLQPVFDNKKEQKTILSPKLNVFYAPSTTAQFFVKSGFGFHSNDTRVVTANTGEDILPSAFSTDIGTVLKPTSKLVLNAALWSLFLEQEFVYVGDAAIVEPSGRTRRLGADLGVRYQIQDKIYATADVNYAYARSTEEPDGEDFIPLAPDFTSAGGIYVKDFKRFSGGLSYRYIRDRPANEDNSIVAEGYFVSDFNVNYNYKNWSFGVVIENLFDTEWNETQFATESRLFNEMGSTEELHFTPGAPFFLRTKISVRF